MAIANEYKLEAARTAFEALGTDIFGGSRESVYGVFTKTFQCDGQFFELPLLDMGEEVAEIVGSRTWSSSRAYVNRAPVKRWGPPGKNIPILQILNDRLGMTDLALADYLSGVANFYEAPVTQFLLSNPTGIDQVALLNASHPYGLNGAVWSNITANALSPAEFRAGLTAMNSLVYESGKPAGRRPNILMVGPSNEMLARELVAPMRAYPVSASGVEAYTSAVGVTTIQNQAQAISVVMNPRFQGANAAAWLLLDTNRASSRPIYVGEAVAPKATSVVDPTSAAMVDRSEAQFYIEGQGALLGGDPRSIYGRLV